MICSIFEDDFCSTSQLVCVLHIFSGRWCLFYPIFGVVGTCSTISKYLFYTFIASKDLFYMIEQKPTC